MDKQDHDFEQSSVKISKNSYYTPRCCSCITSTSTSASRPRDRILRELVMMKCNKDLMQINMLSPAVF